MTRLLLVVRTFSVGGTMMLLLLLLLLLQSVVDIADAAPLADLVESLPEWDTAPLPTTMYSGYLNATDGCDTTVNGDYCYLHYWLCTAEEDEESDDDTEETSNKIPADDKPVVLWLNGGPGSSSILGLLQENGPLLMSATGGLMRNPYAWTKVAHLLILESPIGVGYSYCQAQANGGVCQNTDKYTASAARAALADFYAKFPDLAKNDLFATGESYAGVYLPTLAYEILVYNANLPVGDDDTNDAAVVPIPLKGLAVGDPCTDNTAQKDSMDALWYGHKYGLVDDAVFDLLWNQCQVRLPSYRMNRGRYRAKQDQDNHLSVSVEEWMKSHWTSQTTTDSPECDLALKKFLLSSSRALSQSWRNMYIDDYSLFAPVTNVEDEAMQRYMDRPDVRRALHVTETPIQTWPYPDAGFDYTKEFDACNEDADSTTDLSMIDFYRKLAPQLPGGIWIYNGDTDPCVSYEGTRTAVKRIGFAEVDGGGYRPWFYNHTATTMTVLQEKAVMFGPDLLLQDTGVQFGGEVVNYEYGLSFLTVHGSGHMVPQFRPQAALHMLYKLLAGQALSPLMPSNATLTSLSDDDFMEALDQWTLLAKSAPYVSRYGTPAAALAEVS
jgi:serine carboxypeptidase-like clade I